MVHSNVDITRVAKLADRVVEDLLVLDGGRVVQLGDHATLAREDGPYRRLCEIQGALDASIRADVSDTSASGSTETETVGEKRHG